MDEFAPSFISHCETTSEDSQGPCFSIIKPHKVMQMYFRVSEYKQSLVDPSDAVLMISRFPGPVERQSLFSEEAIVCHCLSIYMWEEELPQWKPGSKGESFKNPTLSLLPIYRLLMNLKVENKSVDHESHGHGHHQILSSVSKNMDQSGTAGEIRSRAGSLASVSQIPTCPFSSYMNYKLLSSSVSSSSSAVKMRRDSPLRMAWTIQPP